MTRLSNGLFLEVLTARPQVGVPLEITVWDGANPATMLAQLQGASNISFQHLLSDVGQGSFTIARDDPKATTANIRDGNLVKVRLQNVDVFCYWIEAPKLIVDEAGKSVWQIAGRSALGYLSQSVVYPPGWGGTITGSDRIWTAATAGTILTTLLAEAQARSAIPHITWDFTATVDSLNDPWDADLNLTTHAGTSLLDVAKQLVALGIDVEVTPELVFRAYKPGTFGRHLESTVIWRQGFHLSGQVERSGNRSALQDAVLVEGAGGHFIEVNDPTTIADPYTGRREGGLSFTSSSDPTTMQRAGESQIAITEADGQAITLPVNHGAVAGQFEPYADYLPGDWITLDVPGQYDLESFQIKGLTLAQTPSNNYTVTASVNAVALSYLARLRNALNSASGSASGASGSASGSLSLGRPTPSATSGTPNLQLATSNAAGVATSFVAADATIAVFDGTVPTASAPGDAAATGSAAITARRDHKHGREAFGLAADIGTETFGASAVAGASGKVADAGHVHVMPASPEGLPLGLAGATAATRYVGATASGAPVAGTFAVGDFVIDQSGSAWVCTVAGSPGTWTQMSGGGMTNPMTTAADLIVGGTGGTPTRLAKGADSQVLTVDPTTHLLVWATPASGFADPTTTKGDLLVHGTSTTRLPVGSDGDVLTVDSTQTLGVKWAAAGGGSGALVAHPLPLDSYAIDATYGDDFTAASLNARWTRRNYAAGAETYQVGKAGTYLRVANVGRANGDGYFQTAPAGDWTFGMAFIPRFFYRKGTAFGVCVVDTNGSGAGTCFYDTASPNAPILVQVTTYSTYGGSYTQPGASGSSPNLSIFDTLEMTDRKVWVYLRKSGTSYYMAYSLDGEVWSPESAALVWAGTVDRVGMMQAPIGTVSTGAGVGTFCEVDWFNKIA